MLPWSNSILSADLNGDRFLHLPPVSNMHLSRGLTGGLATNIDIKPPGVREQVPNPTLLQVWPLRSGLYDHASGTGNLNAPAMPNFGDNINMPAWQQSKWNQSIGTEWFEVTQQTPVKDWWYTHELANFTVPYTGFTALSELRPSSTYGHLF